MDESDLKELDYQKVSQNQELGVISELIPAGGPDIVYQPGGDVMNPISSEFAPVFNTANGIIDLTNPFDMPLIQRRALTKKYEITYSLNHPEMMGSTVHKTLMLFAYIEGSDILMKDLVRIAWDVLERSEIYKLFGKDRIKIISILPYD